MLKEEHRFLKHGHFYPRGKLFLKIGAIVEASFQVASAADRSIQVHVDRHGKATTVDGKVPTGPPACKRAKR